MSETPAPTSEDQARRLEIVNHDLAELLRRPEVAQRLRAAGPDEWSALEIVGHMSEMIGYWMGEARMLAAATGQPPHFGRTLDAPDRLAGPQHGATADPAELLSQLDSTIRTAAADILVMTPVQRAKTGIHNRRGEISISELIEVLIVTHAEEHENQVKQVLGLGS